MAIAVPGPLVARIHGRAGGIVFRSDPRGQILSNATRPGAHSSSAMTACRLALARASLGWQALPAADRRAWSDYASSLSIEHANGSSRAPSGFALYSGSLTLAQPYSLTVPAPPFLLGENAPITPLTQVSSTNLYLTGYNRALAAAESVVWRVSLDTPASTNTRPPRALRSFATIDTQGLTNVDGNAANFPNVNSRLRASYTISPLGSHTVQFWARLTVIGSGQVGWLSSTGPMGLYLLFNAPSQITVRDGGVFTSIAARPSDGLWHHYAHVMDAATLLHTIYIDGVAQATTPAYTNRILGTVWEIGGQNVAPINGIVGALDEFIVFNSTRTPAQILAAYNAGFGHVYTAADAPAQLLHFDSTIGANWPDSSGNAFHMPWVSNTTALTAFARLIMAQAESRYPAGHAWLSASPIAPSQPRALQTQTIFTVP